MTDLPTRHSRVWFMMACLMVCSATAWTQDAEPECPYPWVPSESDEGPPCIAPTYQAVPLQQAMPYPPQPTYAPYPPQPTYAPYPPQPMYAPYPQPMYGQQPYAQPQLHAPSQAPPAPVIIRPLPPAPHGSAQAAPNEAAGDANNDRRRDRDAASAGVVAETVEEHAGPEPATGALAGIRNTFMRSGFTLRGVGVLADDGPNIGGGGLGFRYNLDRNWSFEIAGDALFYRGDKVRMTSLPITATAIANFFPLSSVSPYAAAGVGMAIRDMPWGDGGEDFSQWLSFVGGGLDIKIWSVQLLLDGRYLNASHEGFRPDGSPRGIPSGIQVTVGLGGRW